MSRISIAGILLSASLLLSGSTVIAWRHREAPTANLFAIVTGLGSVGVLMIGAGVAAGLDTAVLALAIAVALLLPIPWSLFVLEYTGRKEFITLDLVVVISVIPAIGLVTTALIFGSQMVPWLTLPARETATGVVAVGVAFLSLSQWFALLYAGGLMLVSSGLLLRIHHKYQHLDPMVGTLLGGFGTVSWLSILFSLQLKSTGSLVMPTIIGAGFLISGLAVSGILSRYNLFRTIPAAGNVGPARVVKELEDIVIVTNSGGTVVEINDATKRTLNIQPSDVVGADVTELLGSSISDLRGSETVELRSVEGRRLFEPTVSDLRDHKDSNIGYALTLRDVTDRVTSQQRLKVLNRVLRHNLRNDMTIILGNAETLREAIGDPQLRERAGQIVRRGEGLVVFAEKAREIDRLMADYETSTEAVSLATLTQDVLAEVAADHPEVTYEHHVPTDTVVEVEADLLNEAMANLLENAVEHNDSEEPRVELRATYQPDGIYPLVVSVADNGPGIPEMEREAILEGEETPLQHGSGLGLWVVRWIVTRLGGEIDIEQREPRGTTVLLRLPRRSETEVETTAASVARS